MPSSVIRRFRYEEHTRTLYVTFVDGDLYAYAEVEREVYDGMNAAPSKGRFFSSQVRDRYAYRKIRSGPPAGHPPGRGTAHGTKA